MPSYVTSGVQLLMCTPLFPLSMFSNHFSFGLGFSSGLVIGFGEGIEVVEFKGTGVSVWSSDEVEFEGVSVGKDVGGGYRMNDSEVGSVQHKIKTLLAFCACSECYMYR